MKGLILFIFLLYFSFFLDAYSQGWTAIVEIDINHPNYGIEQLNNATATYSGITQSVGASSNSKAIFSFSGTGIPSGSLSISASGMAYGPYNMADPFTHAVLVNYTGTQTGMNCNSTGFYASAGSNGEMYGTIRIYPRQEILPWNLVRSCSSVSITSTVCAAGSSYSWEVSESLSGPWKTISGKSDPTMTATPDELYNLGLTNKYGTKFFRVSSISGTTSQPIQTELFYPGPLATFSLTNPKCHDGGDGSIQISIASSTAVIDKFVITVTPLTGPEIQLPDISGFNATVSNLSAGVYSVNIQNNMNVGMYGDCSTDFQADTLNNPTAVTIPAFTVSDYHGYAISCNGGSNGTLKAIPSGGTGTYTAFTWTPPVSTTDFASGLTAQTYKVKTSDSNGCWSSEFNKTLTAPPALSLVLNSTGGMGGYDVSCWNKQDGMITATPGGGVGGYIYTWSTGATSSSISGLEVGTYDILLADANACSLEKSKTLIAPAPINFTIQQLTGLNCQGDLTASFQAQFIQNAIGGIHYAWSSGETVPDISNKGAGTYDLTISDDQGCSTQKSITILDPPAFSVSINPLSDFNGSHISCNGAGDGKLNAVLVDENNNVVNAQYYIWYKNEIPFAQGSTLNTIDHLPEAMYKVSVTYNTGCNTNASYFLNDPDPVLPVINFKSDYNGVPLSCFGTSDASLEVSTAGGTPGYSYAWNTGSSESVIEGLPAGSYWVIATDVNGCTGVTDKIITNPLLVSVSIDMATNYNDQAISCQDAMETMLMATGTGGVGSLSYTWNTGATGKTLKDVGVGTYKIDVKDVNNCSTSGTITLDNPVAVMDLGGSATLCVGQEHVLDAGPQWSTYTWGSSTGFSSTSQRVTIKEAGQYWVDVISKQGCTARDTFLLKTSKDLLQAKLIMASQAFVGDTVVFIDISWPLPESIEWKYPVAMRKILDLGDVVYGQFDQAGMYDVVLTARLGECKDDMTKSITILDKEGDPVGSRLGYENFVKQFELYPSPNDGSFDVHIEVDEVSPVTVSIWSGMTNYLIGQTSVSGEKEYHIHIDLRPLPAGIYVLALYHAKGREFARFIVR